MPWRNQGGGGGGGPWGGGQNPRGRGGAGGPTPPDFEELVRRSPDRFQRLMPRGFGGGRGGGGRLGGGGKGGKREDGWGQSGWGRWGRPWGRGAEPVGKGRRGRTDASRFRGDDPPQPGSLQAHYAERVRWRTGGRPGRPADPGELGVDRHLSGPARRARRRPALRRVRLRSEEHTSELQSLMRTSYVVFCLKKNKILNMPTSPSSEFARELGPQRHFLADDLTYADQVQDAADKTTATDTLTIVLRSDELRDALTTLLQTR